MKITLTELARSTDQYDVVIHSLDRALYQATVALTQGEQLLLDDEHKPLRFRSLQAMREALALLDMRSLTLRHQSAYDEMIGQPPREGSNAMDVPLATVITLHDDTGRAR